MSLNTGLPLSTSVRMDKAPGENPKNKLKLTDQKSPERSEGDGMESYTLSTEKKSKQKSAAVNSPKNPYQVVTPTVNIAGKTTLQVHRSTIKRKEPKFIPHEPYKAAVMPIFDKENLKSEVLPPKSIPQGLYLCGSSTKDIDTPEKESLSTEFPCLCKESKRSLEEEVASLKLERASLETQLKIQTQVNQDLKKLLVASLGEDMQTKVQFLTEDKTKLAHDIVHYSQKLMEDSEHREKLAIQCDVWRSKFLASSLMVDELARWKAVLNHQLDEALHIIKVLFGELEKISKHSTSTLSYLNSISEKCGCGLCNQKHETAENAIAITEEIEHVAKLLHEKLCGSELTLAAASGKQKTIHNLNMTSGQQMGYQILTHCLSHNQLNPENVLPECHSCAFSHLYKGGVPRFHPSARYEHLTFNCCYQCRGDIKLM